MTEDAAAGAPLFHTLWAYHDPAGTETRFRARLADLAPTADREAYAQLLTQLARTHSLRGQFAQAHQILNDAAAVIDDATPIARIRLLLERGRTHNSAGEQAAARPFFTEAYVQAVAVGSLYHAVDAAHMMGIAAATAAEQIHWHERALELARNARETAVRQWTGSLLNNLGWSYHDRAETEKALQLFEEALRWQTTAADPRRPERIRIAQWCVARMLRALGRVEEALVQQQALHQAWQEAGGEDGYVSEEVAECLWALGRQAAARPHFAQAYALLSQDAWLAQHESARLERLRRLGTE